MKLALALSLSLALPAAAQTESLQCIPEIPTAGWVATTPMVNWNAKGICAAWTCIPATGNAVRWTFCGTWAEFAKVPGRIATIKNAADPLKSARSAGNRYPILPMTDPSMTGMPLP